MCERNGVVGSVVVFVEGDLLFSSLLLPAVPCFPPCFPDEVVTYIRNGLS